MKIRYRESGGFAGVSRGANVDTASLSESEARRVIALVERAELAESSRRGPAGARDLTLYEIVIEDEGGEKVVRFDDASVPDTADDLLAYLQGRARPIPLR